MGNVNLKIDCSRLSSSQIDGLSSRLRQFLSEVIVVGGDLIYASGRIDTHDYQKVWNVINWFDVTVS